MESAADEMTSSVELGGGGGGAVVDADLTATAGTSSLHSSVQTDQRIHHYFSTCYY